MSINHVANEYQIPRGRVYFDPFDANGNLTGEEPFGNCPGVTLNIASTKADHYSSESGLRVKDASVVVEVNRGGTLQVDNISVSNLGRFLAATHEEVSQTDDPVAGAEYVVRVGRQYQLGQTPTNPGGHRDISTVVITTDDVSPVTLVLGDDYELDAARGRMRILPGGLVEDGDTIVVGYSKPERKWYRLRTGSQTELRGALRIIADNASGDNRDYYMPDVTLTPDGDLPIITDGVEFIAMSMGLEVLDPPNASAIYVDGQPQPV